MTSFDELTIGELIRVLGDSLGISHQTLNDVQSAHQSNLSVRVIINALANTRSQPEELVQDGGNVLTEFQQGVLRVLRDRKDLASRMNELIRGDCIVRGEIGRGGFGGVYRAFDRKRKQVVALKLLQLSLHNQRAKEPVLKVIRNRFEAEAKRLMKFSCPGLPQVYEYGPDKKEPYIVMEYIAGRNLEDIVTSDGPIPVALAESYLVRLAEVLVYLHGCDTPPGETTTWIVHRDIKPKNVVIDSHGDAWLVDFGIARFSDAETQTAGPIGSWDYASPEQFDDAHNATPASDLYSLGCTLYFGLTGKAPFSGEDYFELRTQQKETARPRLTDAGLGLPSWIDRIIFKMMAVELEHRYADPLELLDDVFRSWKAHVVINRMSAAATSNTANAAISAMTSLPLILMRKSLPVHSTALSPTGRPRRIIHEPDGSEMVLVEQRNCGFEMGCDDGPADCRPRHPIFLTDYYIDICLVTNRQFALFADDPQTARPPQGPWRKHYPNQLFDDYPVRDVTWDDASAYCQWAHKLLPTEAQWECAATAGDERFLPWPEHVSEFRRADFCFAWGRNTDAPTYVGSRLPNKWGIFDATGNVAQWVDDWYVSKLYERRSRGETNEELYQQRVINPRITEGGNKRVVRGQSFAAADKELLLHLRDCLEPEKSSPWIGFRTVCVLPRVE